ncbi:hypothetical protein C1H46_028263 [Malus baccata]|uniref:Beta-amylase n=1 Tax=Malus baccata TaxID=106549 RepID=A0A540LI85_MALBA|nr:hypothetical protein C1H46_028263 [Malus baccata]
MAMEDNGRVVCKCTTSSRSFFCFIEFSFDDRPNRRNLLRNVSTLPVFKKGLFTRCSPSLAGNSILRIKALIVALKALKLAGVHGIAVEVWWGIVERFSPLAYDWSLYEGLFKLISNSGLKLHVALSFHSNVNSSSSRKGGVTLPLWIIEIGDQNKHIYYRDQNGFSNDDYLTLGVDHVPLFCSRTTLQCYEDFLSSFAKKFESLIGTVIEEISVGLGPSGGLKYPAHPFGYGRWKFPGISEFQCYDQCMMGDLKMAARKEGKPQWGEKGPQNAGCYNSLPSEVPFFEEGEESILIMGVFSFALRDGYDHVASILSHHGAALHVSSLEMMDGDNPASYLCSPEGLLQQVGLTHAAVLVTAGRAGSLGSTWAWNGPI